MNASTGSLRSMPRLMEFQILLCQSGSTFDAPGFNPGSLIDRLDVAFRPLFAPYHDRLCTARLSGSFRPDHLLCPEACGPPVPV